MAGHYLIHMKGLKMAKYEAHITFDIKYEGVVKEECEKPVRNKWKFSRFYGDPVLGEKMFCYMSMNIDELASSYSYIYTEEQLLASMMMMCGEMKARGIKPLRAKIEQVRYDTRF